MRLIIENVAKVKHAEIDLLGITTLIGYNGTGKSTISKSLATIGDAFSDFEQQIDGVRLDEVAAEVSKWEEKNRTLLRRIRVKMGKAAFEDYKRFDALFTMVSRRIGKNNELIKNLLEYEDPTQFQAIMVQNYQLYDWVNILTEWGGVRDDSPLNVHQQLDELFEKIDKIKFSISDKYEKNIIDRAIHKYFGSQISSFYDNNEGIITLIDEKEDNRNKISFVDNQSNKYEKNIVDNISIIYIQPYSILDSNSSPAFFSINSILYGGGDYFLNKRLQHDFPNNATPSAFETRDRLNKIVSSVLDREKNIGVLTKDDWGLVYKDSSTNQTVEMCNVASGIKNIAIIKRLIMNGELKEDSILIIDEPEVNLHPEWQLKLAELLVQLYSNANIKIFINTHSPFFLRAIEYYSDNFGLLDRCRFYYMQNMANEQSVAIDKTEFLNEIYESMATILDNLQ